MAVKRLGNVVCRIRTAINSIPDLSLSIGERVYPCFGKKSSCSTRNSRCSQGLFMSLQRGLKLLSNFRGKSLCIVAVEVRDDIFRMMGFTVIAFSVVFQDKFPVGLNLVIDNVSNFSLLKSLDFYRFLQVGLSPVEVGRMLSQTDIDQPSHRPNRN